MFDRFTDRARKVMGLARHEAQRFNHDFIGTEHVLLGLVREGGGVGATALQRLGLDLGAVRVELEHRLTPGTGTVTFGNLPFTADAKQVLERSLEEASQFGHTYIGTEHLLLGLLRVEAGVGAQVLAKLGVRLDAARAEITKLLGESEPPAGAPRAPVELFQATPALGGPTEGARLPSGIVHEPLARPTEREHATPELDAYTVDVARSLADAPRAAIVGRDALLDRVVDVLHRRARPNVLLVGPPGVGKTAVVDELARRCATGTGAGRLTGCRVVRLDVPALVAGTKYRGQLEERARRLLAALRNARNVVVHVEDARLLATSGFSTESMKVAEALAPLVRGEAGAMILTVTPEAATPTLERLGVAHYFTSVEVAEPEPAAARAMVAAHRDLLAAHHGVEVTDDAIEVAIAGGLTLVHRHLPSSALDLLDETCARVARRGPASPRPVVDAAAVRATLVAARPPER